MEREIGFTIKCFGCSQAVLIIILATCEWRALVYIHVCTIIDAYRCNNIIAHCTRLVCVPKQ